MMEPPAWLPIALAGLAAALFALGNLRVRRLIGRSPDVFSTAPGTALAFLGRAHRVAFAATGLGVVLAWVWQSPAPAWWAAAEWLGNLAMLLGCGLMAAAQRAMGASWRIGIDRSPTDLVMAGPFSLSRNPTFVGMFLLLWGALLAAPGMLTAAGLAAALVSFPTQVRMEEEHLIARHGDAFRAYAARVPRWLGWPRATSSAVS
jgi:protein-S-isoprenylcysteine O-methyltransferase Ste14